MPLANWAPDFVTKWRWIRHATRKQWPQLWGWRWVRKTWIYNRYLRVPCVPYDKWYVMIFMQNLYVYVCIYIYIIRFILYAFHNSDSCLDQTGKFARKSSSQDEKATATVRRFGCQWLSLLPFLWRCCSFSALTLWSTRQGLMTGGMAVVSWGVWCQDFLWWCIDLSMIGWQWSIQ